MKKSILIFAMTAFLTSCTRDVDSTKKEAPEFFKERGYKIVSYDGYTTGLFSGGTVWYVVKDSSGFIYSLAIQEWWGELHIYNQKCLNAVSNEK
jgi:hypothetical protein